MMRIRTTSRADGAAPNEGPVSSSGDEGQAQLSAQSKRSPSRTIWLSAPAVVSCGYLLLGTLTWTGLDSPVRPTLALLLSLLGPGFSLLALILPRSAGLDLVERAGLAAALSLAVGGLLAVALARSPATLAVHPVIAIGIGFNVACLIGLAYRRQRDPSLEEPPLSGAAGRLRDRWHDQGRSAPLVGVTLALALVGGAVAVGLAASKADDATPLTEFFIDDPGLVENLEPTVAAGRPLRLRWGVSNHEGEPARYRIRALVDGREVARTSDIQLSDEGTGRGTIEIPLAATGDPDSASPLRLNLILDQDGRPHRRLQLWIRTEGVPDDAST
jgi:uncharacterized membrane protein